MTDGHKTECEHWDEIYAAGGDAIRMRLPSRLRVDVRNFTDLVRRYVQPGARVLEVGCAPGKQLAWLRKVLGARVAGVDYAPRGIATTRRLLDAVGVTADLRCEDFFATTFEPASFDIVYSLGVVEHFDDPRPIVEKHVELLVPGGVALVVIPNYRGPYGALQRWFDASNLELHNLDIMSTDALAQLAPASAHATTFTWGRMSPGPVSWERRLPAPLARAIHLAGNAVALLQPVPIAALSPWLVLELRRHA
jgi:2-polyprenyl-3-methyl-5-hydroxy-6-metoxy-1,4-benzoquinol methylase